VLAEAIRQLAQHHLGALCGRRRVAVDGRKGEGDLAFRQPPAVVEPEGDRADLALAPPVHGEREPGGLAVDRGRACRLDALAWFERPAGVVGVARHGHIERRGLALVHTGRGEADADPEPILATARAYPSRAEQQERRSGHAGQLRAPGDDRKQQGRGGKREQAAGVPGRPPGHGDVLRVDLDRRAEVG